MTWLCKNCGAVLPEDECVFGDSNDAAPFPNYHIVPDGERVGLATYRDTVCGPIVLCEPDEPRYAREPYGGLV